MDRENQDNASTAQSEHLEAEITRLNQMCRKYQRELDAANSQLAWYRKKADSKDNLSRVISAEKARQEKYVGHMLRVLPEIAIVLDNDFNVVLCSQKYMDMLGLTDYAQLIGKSPFVDDLVYFDSISGRDLKQSYRDQILRNEPLTIQMKLRFQENDPLRNYRVDHFPIYDGSGTPDGMIIVFVDIDDLSNALERAENASKAKSDFLSNMSHEIRTPMNAIIGMTSIAKSTSSMERKNYCLQKVEEASVHLLGVINDILDMSKIEAQKFDLSMTDFNLERMLMRITNVVGYSIDQKSLNMVVRINPNIPKRIVCDEQHLSQVVTNLLSNAIKFTPESGTITLSVDEVGRAGNVSTLKFAVNDTGIGITDEQKARLFQSFEQADTSISRRFGGTGLGLAISKEIVSLMGGRIWVESTYGEGSTFAFTIEAELGEEIDEDIHIEWGNLTMMAVDDQIEVLDFFEVFAMSHNCICHTASSGEEALKKLAEMPTGSVKIFFIDWQMPGMNGVELARRIRESDNGNAIIVMISAYQWDDIAEEAKAAGIYSYVPKPLFSSAIMDSINRFFTVKRSAPDKAPPLTAYAGAFAGKRLLLAEDIEINQEIVRALLEDTGLQIDCADNGQIAFELFSANPDRYDMIFMDIHMPVVDGYKATAMIRGLNHARAKCVPIVAMTADVFKEDIDTCIKAGMNDHVGKPLDMTEVIEKLHQYL